MLPYKDENPTRTFPIVTVLLIAACVVIYFFVQPLGREVVAGKAASGSQADIEFTLKNAAIPCEVAHDRPITVEELQLGTCESRPASPPVFPRKHVLFAILYSMFLHGSLVHLGGNMLFLWIFGNNVEDAMGKVQYLLFYLIGGLFATAGHIAVQPASTIPVVGASGAIAAVMGAYLVLYPRVRIRSLLFFFIFVRVQARWLLLFWFLEQFFVSPSSGVAWVAHVAGFTFGALVALFWRNKTPAVTEYVLEEFVARHEFGEVARDHSRARFDRQIRGRGDTR